MSKTRKRHERDGREMGDGRRETGERGKQRSRRRRWLQEKSWERESGGGSTKWKTARGEGKPGPSTLLPFPLRFQWSIGAPWLEVGWLVLLAAGRSAQCGVRSLLSFGARTGDGRWATGDNG